jgi:branched-chain amino acid transport system permease protein
VGEFLQFAVLGLGAGGAYAISGIGLTQIYRGSGVLNLLEGSRQIKCRTGAR